MADDVCDSWEDILENGDPEKKADKRASKSSRSSDASSSSSGFRILQRDNSSASAKSVSSQPIASKSSSFDMNNLVNCEPFVPVGRGPQITFEDSTRTQPKPSIKILKREKVSSSDANQQLVNQQAMKTYEERAADYKKARERIMGCPGDGDDVPSTMPPIPTATSDALLPTPNFPPLLPLNSGRKGLRPAVNSVKNDQVPVARLPQAPDGSRGFRR